MGLTFHFEDDDVGTHEFDEAYTLPLISSGFASFTSSQLTVANPMKVQDNGDSGASDSDDFLDACKTDSIATGDPEFNLSNKTVLFQYTTCDLTTAVRNLIARGAAAAIHLYGDGAHNRNDKYSHRFAYNPLKNRGSRIPVMRLHGRDPARLMHALGCRSKSDSGDSSSSSTSSLSSLPCTFANKSIIESNVVMHDQKSPWLDLYQSWEYWILVIVVLISATLAGQHIVRSLIYLHSSTYRKRVAKRLPKNTSKAALSKHSSQLVRSYERNRIIARALEFLLFSCCLLGLDFIVSQIRDAIPMYVPEVIPQLLFVFQFVFGIGAVTMVLFYWNEILAQRAKSKVIRLSSKNKFRFKMYMVIFGIVSALLVFYYSFFLPFHTIVQYSLIGFLAIQGTAIAVLTIIGGIMITKRMSSGGPNRRANNSSQQPGSRVSVERQQGRYIESKEELTKRLRPLLQFVVGIATTVLFLALLAIVCLAARLHSDPITYLVSLYLLASLQLILVGMFLFTLSPLWQFSRANRANEEPRKWQFASGRAWGKLFESKRSSSRLDAADQRSSNSNGANVVAYDYDSSSKGGQGDRGSKDGSKDGSKNGSKDGSKDGSRDGVTTLFKSIPVDLLTSSPPSGSSAKSGSQSQSLQSQSQSQSQAAATAATATAVSTSPGNRKTDSRTTVATVSRFGSSSGSHNSRRSTRARGTKTSKASKTEEENAEMEAADNDEFVVELHSMDGDILSQGFE